MSASGGRLDDSVNISLNIDASMAQLGSGPEGPGHGMPPSVMSLERLATVDARELRWTRSARLAWTLAAGAKTVAVLRWARSGGSLAAGDSAEGSWTFKRGGFLHPKVRVRERGSEADIAVLEMGRGGGGILHLADGMFYTLRRLGFWHPDWAITDARGRKLLTLEPRRGCPDEQATARLEDAAFDSVPSTLLLAILGWYVSQLVSQEVSDAGIIAALVGAGAI